MRLAPLSHRRTHRLATPAANGRGEARARRTTRDGGGAPAVERRRLATAQHAAHEPSLPPVPLQRHDRNARLPARPAPQHRRHARSLRCCGRRELPPRGHRRPRTRHRPARRGAPREPALRTVARPSLESAAARAARHAARHATQQHRTLMPLLNRRQPRRPRRRHAAVGPAEQRAPLARRLAVHLAPSPPRPHLWTARPPTERPQPPLRLLALRNRAVAPLRESLGQHARLQHAAAQQSDARVDPQRPQRGGRVGAPSPHLHGGRLDRRRPTPRRRRRQPSPRATPPQPRRLKRGAVAPRPPRLANGSQPPHGRASLVTTPRGGRSLHLGAMHRPHRPHAHAGRPSRPQAALPMRRHALLDRRVPPPPLAHVSAARRHQRNARRVRPPPPRAGEQPRPPPR